MLIWIRALFLTAAEIKTLEGREMLVGLISPPVTDWLLHNTSSLGERGGSVVECRTPEREVRGSRPTAAVLCPWARHFTPRKYWLITQEAMAPSRYDWKNVDWDVKPQHNQPTNLQLSQTGLDYHCRSGI